MNDFMILVILFLLFWYATKVQEDRKAKKDIIDYVNSLTPDELEREFNKRSAGK